MMLSEFFIAIKEVKKERTKGIYLSVPRDNVIFEMGMFMQAKGRDRVLVFREQGAKMPA